jgi:hypothetical protein
LKIAASQLHCPEVVLRFRDAKLFEV